MVAGFCGGSEACVRQVVGAVRGLFCFEYRCGHSARLLPQETSAGAKPNHAFSKCQHFCKNNFRPTATLLPSRVAAARAANLQTTRRQQQRCRCTFKKHRVSCSFVTQCLQPGKRDTDTGNTTHPFQRRPERSERARNRRRRRQTNLAMHQSKCADLRKLFLPCGSHRAHFGKLFAVIERMIGLTRKRSPTRTTQPRTARAEPCLSAKDADLENGKAVGVISSGHLLATGSDRLLGW